MAENWSFVRRQDEASRWLQMSAYGFWLRHPDGLEVRTPFWRIGEELYVLELDLTECLNEFENSFQELYKEGRHLAPKKFSIVYHTDNFYVRVHKFVENVHALIALVAGDGKANELLDLLRDIQVFRDKLYSILLRGVAGVVSAYSGETRERLQLLLDWAEAWRELGQSAHR